MMMEARYTELPTSSIEINRDMFTQGIDIKYVVYDRLGQIVCATASEYHAKLMLFGLNRIESSATTAGDIAAAIVKGHQNSDNDEDVNCPHCGETNTLDFDFLSEFEDDAENLFECQHCSQQFEVTKREKYSAS
jgi:phage terminase large subunit GpA-like protein